MRSFSVRTSEREQFVDVSRQVAEIVAELHVAEGVCHVYVAHTTAGVTVNENADPTVPRDVLTTLRRLVPHRGDYRHAEGNSDAHVKTSLVGSSAWVPVSGGKLALGTWQGIFLCEFDGPRQRTVHVTAVAAGGA